MTHLQKQMKITKLFKRGATQIPEECDGIQQEIEELEQILREKHDDWFQLQRNRHRNQSVSFNAMTSVEKKSETFIRPEKIILSNSVESLEREIELMSLLCGMEVQSYETGHHCAIVYHLQHDSQYQVKHGLKIDMSSGKNTVSSTSLPLGFNLSAVLDQYDNVMLPECLVAVRKALVAYYDRLQQFDTLKGMLKMDAQLFKILDGTHMEVRFPVCRDLESAAGQIGVTLTLDYRLFDIRPKRYSFVDIDLPEGSVEALREQCAIFKCKPLHKAFREAFIDGVGPYVMVQQMKIQPTYRRRHKRSRPNAYNANDDTFHPDDCSSEDDVEE